jgi:hypothetical protein
VPSPHAHLPDDDAAAGSGAPGQSRFQRTAVRLDDIDRLLEETSGSGPLERAAVRSWRDDLVLVLEALRYARAILAADVLILRHAASADSVDPKTLVDELPGVLGGRPSEGGWSEAADADPLADLDPDVFVRADDLVSVHREMAGVALADAGEVARVLDLIEDTLVAVTAYQAAVEVRLQAVRAAILRQYVEDAATSPEHPR